MDFKQSLIVSCVIVLGIAGMFSGYSIYQNNIKMHENYIEAQDAFRNSNLKQADKLLEGNPPRDIEKEFYLLKYNVEMNLNKLYQAEQTALQLLKINPKDAFYNYLLGLVYFNLDDREKTELYLKNAVEFSPQNVDYKIHLANCYANYGKDDEAIKLYKELKDLIPGYEIAYASIATIYENKNDLENALKYRKEAAEKFSDNAYDLYMLAKLYEKTGKKDEAAEYYAKTAKLDVNENTDARTKYFALTGKPYHSAPQFKSETIPFKNVNGLMIVNIKVNGVPANFLIDTGATSSLVYANFIKNKQIPVKTNVFGITTSANGTKSVVPIANLNLKLGSMEFNNLPTYIMPAENKVFDGIIGNDILQKTDYYADRQQGVIVIKSIK